MEVEGEREGDESRKEREKGGEGEGGATAGRGLIGMPQAGRLKKNFFVVEGVGVSDGSLKSAKVHASGGFTYPLF
jgi:hypothetical protein